MTFRTILAALLFAAFSGTIRGVADQMVALREPQLWRQGEWRIEQVPVTSNPFDPDVMRVDVLFSSPSGKTLSVPAFWYQAYRRSLSGNSENLSVFGNPEWRVRFTPAEPGDYSMQLSITINGQTTTTGAEARFTVIKTEPSDRHGFVRISSNKQYFETGDGRGLALVGANHCWPGSRGTYDYDDWFRALRSASGNYSRLWMCPWAFGIETEQNTLTRFQLDRAWQLDYVFEQASVAGVYLLLCLDYHGMFETEPDYWGSNNYWNKNPYNRVNGGPCANQNAFFSATTARTLYQKRLRYLIARYGASPNLLAWEFFNEIDNVYKYLNSASVADWHRLMGQWVKTNDPYGHLVTTSLGVGNERPEIWNIPQIDFVNYHSYETPFPGTRFGELAQSIAQRYGKPVLIGEFGVDWRGWSREKDPYLRGFRQGIWGAALGGSAGTAMSWWWEDLYRENVYPVLRAAQSVLTNTSWGEGIWKPIEFYRSGLPPTALGELLPDGSAFSALITPGSEWGSRPSGQLAVANGDSVNYSVKSLNSYIHGSTHPELKTPFKLSAWLTNNAKVWIHLNSVSAGAILSLRVDGVERFRTNLVNKDGTWEVNNEYNVNFVVNLPAGKHSMEISNPGADWCYLDWVRLEGVLPAEYSRPWHFSVEATGLRGEQESLLYILPPAASFPNNAKTATLPLQKANSVVLLAWPTGIFKTRWYLPKTGQQLAETFESCADGTLTLALPDYREDLVGVVTRVPALTALGQANGMFEFRLSSDVNAKWFIDSTGDLVNWSEALIVTNTSGDGLFGIPINISGSNRFIRARQGIERGFSTRERKKETSQ